MTQQPLISVVFKTTFIPTGAYYYGVHNTTDIFFGNPGFTDPYIGNGTKLIALAKQTGNRRGLFNVQAILVSTQDQCDKKLKSLLDNLDYSNPAVLNSREGYPRGRPQTPEALENRGAALSVAMKGNENALGHRPWNIDIDTPNGTKLKWFHAPDNSEQKMIVCDMNDNPIKEAYKGWKLGKVNRAQKRLEEIKTETTQDE